jgi:ligand-binding SRPBCC domain-containing protein
MTHTFHAEQWIPYPIELVFAFFANPENLPRLMPSWQKARIEEAAFAAPPPRPLATDPTLRLRSIAAGPGTRVTISFRPFPYSPLRVPWEAEISEFVWNDHFCDLQLRGPLAFWRHCHRFQSESRATPSGTATPGTLLTDDVEYSPPYGAVGTLANQLFIARQIRSNFAYRHQRTLDSLPLVFPTR